MSSNSSKKFSSKGADHLDNYDILRKLVPKKYLNLALSIQNIIDENLAISLKMNFGNSINILPVRLIFIDDKIYLQGENIDDNGALSLNLSDIKSYKSYSVIELPSLNVSIFDELSRSYLSMENKEYRVILRSKCPGEGIFPIQFHYLGDSYFIWSKDGSMVYVANMFLSKSLLKYFEILDGKMDILSPERLIKEYKEYKDKKDNVA